MLCVVNLQHKMNAIQQRCPMIYKRNVDYKATFTVETLRTVNRIMKNGTQIDVI